MTPLRNLPGTPQVKTFNTSVQVNNNNNKTSTYSNIVKKNLTKKKTTFNGKKAFFPTEEDIEKLLKLSENPELTTLERLTYFNLPDRQNSQRLFIYAPDICSKFTESYIINSIYKDNEPLIWKNFLNTITCIRTTRMGIEIWFDSSQVSIIKELEGQKLKICSKEYPMPSMNKFANLYWILLRYIPSKQSEWLEIINYFEETLATPILGIFHEKIDNIGNTINIKFILKTTVCPEDLFLHNNLIPIQSIKTPSMEQEIKIFHRNKKYNKVIPNTQPPDEGPPNTNPELNTNFSTNIEKSQVQETITPTTVINNVEHDVTSNPTLATPTTQEKNIPPTPTSNNIKDPLNQPITTTNDTNQTQKKQKTRKTSPNNTKTNNLSFKNKITNG